MRAIGEPMTFGEAASGVHRQIPTPVGHPALIRQLCLWERSSRTEEERVESVNGYLLFLRDAIAKSIAVSSILHMPWEFNFSPYSRGQSTTLQFFWHHLSASVRLELHSEYITILCILDLSYFPDLRIDYQIQELKKSDPIFSKICKAVQLLTTNVGPPKSKTLSDFIYGAIWGHFYSSIVDNNGILGCNLGDINGDFRGIITGQPKLQGEEDLSTRLPVRAFECSPPFTKPESRRGGRHDYRVPEISWRRDTIRAIVPFLQSDPNVAGYEFTASAFLGGRVVYVSALGPPEPASRKDKLAPKTKEKRSYVPICFYLHSATDDEWDLGRLVDQVTRMGTLRVVSVFQLNDLHRANAELVVKRRHVRQLSQDIAYLSSQVSAQIESQKDAFNSRLLFIGERLTKIRQRRAIDTPFRGGLAFRVQRSLYYIDTFHATLSLVDEKPVDGYQPYSEFITRRLGESFAYIKIMSSMLNDLDNIENEVATAYASLQMVSLTIELKNISVATQLNTDAINREDEEMESIQGFGEVLLILVLFPYYFSHALEGIFSNSFENEVERILSKSIWIFGALMGVGLYRYRLGDSIKKRNQLIAHFRMRLDAATDPAAKQVLSERMSNLVEKIAADKKRTKLAMGLAIGIGVVGAIQVFRVVRDPLKNSQEETSYNPAARQMALQDQSLLKPQLPESSLSQIHHDPIMPDLGKPELKEINGSREKYEGSQVSLNLKLDDLFRQ